MEIAVVIANDHFGCESLSMTIPRLSPALTLDLARSSNVKSGTRTVRLSKAHDPSIGYDRNLGAVVTIWDE